MTRADRGREDTTRRLPAALQVLLLLLPVLAVLYPEAIFSGATFFDRDVHIIWFSQIHSLQVMQRAGSWPLWDPFVSFGHPFLANLNAQVLYPPTWLHLLLPPGAHYTVLTVLHMLFAGVGTTLLARRLGLAPAGAVAAGVFWVVSGPVQSLVNVWNHLAGATWMPWVLWAAEGALEAPGLRSAAWLALAVAGQLLAGSPDMSVYTAAAVGAFGLYRLLGARERGRPQQARMAGALALAALLAVGLTAVQWMTTLDIARRSERWKLDPQMRLFWSVHPATLVQLALPAMVADLPWQPEMRQELFNGREALVRSLYLGIGVCALAAAAWARPPTGRHRGFLLGLFLGCTLVTLGRHLPVHDFISRVFPLFAVIRYPSKGLVLPALALALLAGFGVEAWRQTGQADGLAWRRAAAVPALALALASLLGAYAASFGLDAVGGAFFIVRPGDLPLREMLAPLAERLAVAGVAAGLLAGLALLRGRWLGQADHVAAAVAALAALDLVSYHRELNPVAPAALIQDPPPLRAEIRQQDLRRLYVYEYQQMEGKARRYLGRESAYALARLPPERRSPQAGAMAIRMYGYPHILARWSVFHSYDLDQLILYPTPLAELTRFLRAAEGIPAHLRLLQMGAVSQMVALHHEGLEALPELKRLPALFAEDIRVLTVPDPLPRSFVVSGARVGDGPYAFQALLDEGFDPRREVLLPEGSSAVPRPDFAGESRIETLLPDRVRLSARLSAPGYLVLVDAWDPGWRVSVDGAAAPLLRANVAFRGVQLPAGDHVVEMVYRPAAVLWGAALSGASVLLLALLAARGRPAAPPDDAAA